MAEFNLGRIRFVWKGNWSSTTTYVKDDVVRYGGKTYICVIGHTSDANFYTNLDAVPTKWNQMSDGQEWRNNWNTSTDYNINDIVKYGGQLYICNDPHTSAATTSSGLEADQSKWDLFAESFDWKTNWNTSTRYKVNDIVKYGGITYICNQAHTSAISTTLGLEADQSKWDYLHKGIEYRSTWSGSSIRYRVNDVVKYGAGVWICITAHTSSATFAEVNWEQFVEGLEFEDSWNDSAIYQPGDIVTYGGYVYVAKTNNTNETPTTSSSNWNLYVTGFKFEGDWSLPNFYEVGNVVRYGGYTYLCIQDHEAGPSILPSNITYWSRLNSGIIWRGNWQNGLDYILGDSIIYESITYTCVTAHTSSTLNRPDNDTTGSYWNILASGTETNVLTTPGDLVYYGGAGPTRLPIGPIGSVLKVNANQEPSWGYFGKINQIFYVATTGEDNPSPLNGITIDRPWKTIQYATQQIEKGAFYPNTRYLLEVNRQFIQAEVTAWIALQIAGNNSPFTGSFTYDSAKCERDIGLIVDALAYDLSHGGNSKTRQAALSYGSEAAAFYLLGQKEETIAAITHAYNLITDIIQNITVLNSQSPVAVSQVSDSSKTSEDGASIILNSLVNALTGAINSVDDSSNIFDEVKVNYTINVKTGTFQEVLPISIPVNTVVVGDELRSSRIEPAGSLIFGFDVAKSIDGLNHLASIIDNVIQNNTSFTTYGTLVQNTTRPAGSSGAATAAASLIITAKNYIDFNINAVGLNPTMYGSNYWSLDEDFYNAIVILELNKEFLADEVVEYIGTTYPSPGYIFDADACKRDVREYIDAVKWDMIYSSNYKTLTAAKLYVNAVNGSTAENMFYVRNGTGLRNCTVAGLTGTLSSPNIYGTRRPTAGAYVSLDPGWGPDDERVWITTKSCYVQNVTTFGTAAIGMKVDGSLHNSGNDSIVANDFTQVISDGIGAWVTNNGRAELVSVFSYYAHIGYLAENGGKIRATNGNSSYGNYGCVSEGGDVFETPVLGKINNRAVEAIVDTVYTDGSSQIYRFEYLNAGIKYNTASYTINGPGLNAVTVADEFRDDGVFNVRLTDFGDSSGTGGTGYITASNTAQTGDTTSITLSATDSALSSTYVGMAIYIIGGTGAGQYGYIQAYNSGSKVATIYKNSTGTAGWDHVIPGTTIASGLDVTSSYIIEPRLTFSSPGFTSTPRTLPNGEWNDVVFGNYSTTFTNVAATGGSGVGAQFTVLKSGNYYGVTITTPGTGYKIDDVLTIPGTSLNASSPDNDITITVFKVVAGGITVFEFDGTAEAGRYVAVTTGSTVSAYSVNGTAWVAGGALPVSGNWKVAYGKDNSTWVAINTAGTQTARTVNGGITWTSGGALPAGTWVNITYGNGRFVVIGTGTSAAYSTNDGTSWVAMTSLPSATWTNVTYGAGLFVAVAAAGTVAASSSNGTSWTSRTIPSGNYVAVAFGKNKFVAIPASGTSGAYSNNGTTWGTMTVPSASYTDVAYGQGVFFAVSQSTTAATSEDGINWTSRTMSTSANGYSAIAFGNSNETGVWAAVQRGAAGTVASSVLTGCTTQARAFVSDEKITAIRIVEPGSGYVSAPAITIIDPNNISEASTQVRIGKGVLASPTFNNRGTGWIAATATTTGNGFADIYQTGSYISMKNLTDVPVAGSNVQITGINDVYYKLVSVTNLLTQGDKYTATLQLSPPLGAAESPNHEEDVTIKIRYSQVRLTGHDFLDIGTGNFVNTNYPNQPLIDPDQTKETNELGGGRVFYTSTDQDGNFRVGDIFSVEQSTGVATLNADSFSIAGLQELSLGAVSLGGGGATITEFSTDPFFTADSDSVIPTQRAIKAYISAQIGSGSSSLNVNTLTAGAIYIAGDTITTTTGIPINVTANMNFKNGVDGAPVALGMFLLK